MNKKRIFQSSAMLLAVAAITIGGTGAFFSDSEQSTGNVFTAGAVDLTIDHTAATYNNEDCTTRCDKYAKQVVSFEQGLNTAGNPVNPARSSSTATLGAPQSTGNDFDGANAGTDFFSLGFGGNIVLKFPSGIDDGVGPDIKIYEATGGTSYPTESVKVEVSVDGNDWTAIPVSPQDIDYDGTIEIDLNNQAPLVYFVRLTDTTNPALHASDPAADGYDVDAVEALHCASEETDGVASDIWQCQLWEATDLTTETFFDFSDLKPQDSGSNLISLHVDSNDAYACLNVTDTEDNENNLNDPESESGDTSTIEGELGTNLMVRGFYSDVSGTQGDELFPATAIKDLTTITYGDSVNDRFIAGNTTEYIKLEWCLGEFNTDGTCDGDVPDINQSQTDSFLANLKFNAIQTRNNDQYLCADSAAVVNDGNL